MINHWVVVKQPRQITKRADFIPPREISSCVFSEFEGRGKIITVFGVSGGFLSESYTEVPRRVQPTV